MVDTVPLLSPSARRSFGELLEVWRANISKWVVDQETAIAGDDNEEAA
jgi:hypothetical protein